MTKKVPVAENRSVEVTRRDVLEVVVDTLGNRYASGDIVATPDGVGVVSGILTSDKDDLPGGGSVAASDSQPAYVVGFGGEFGIYRASTLSKVDSVTSNASTDGEALYFHNGPEDITESDLPEGWDENSLLSWWAEMGAEFSEAVDDLIQQPDIDREAASRIVADRKQQILGTNEQIGR